MINNTLKIGCKCYQKLEAICENYDFGKGAFCSIHEI